MNTLQRCAEEAQALAAEIQTSDARVDDTRIRDVRARLIGSAVRVLRQAAAADGGLANDVARTSAGTETQSESPGDRLWNLTCSSTALRAERADLASIDEAVAALQTISCIFPGSSVDVAVR